MRVHDLLTRVQILIFSALKTYAPRAGVEYNHTDLRMNYVSDLYTKSVIMQVGNYQNN